MDIYELIKALVTILVGWIVLLLMRKEKASSSWDISYGTAKYGAIALIAIGTLYLLYLIIE